MRDFVKRRPFLFFYCLALVLFTGGIGLGIYIEPNYLEISMQKMEALGFNHGSVFVSAALLQNGPVWILGFIIPGAPAIAAVVTTIIIGEPGAMKRLFARFKPVGEGITGREALIQYAILLACGITVVAAGLSYSSIVYGDAGVQQCLDNLRASSPLLMISMFFLACFTEEGALLEELGWRGFALPLLMQRLKTPLHAAIILGVAWSFWHFARNVMPLIYGMPLWDWVLSELNFLTGAIASTVVMVYFVNRLGGSIIPAIFIHGLGNYGFNYIAGDDPVVLGFTFDTFIRVVGALIVIAIAGQNLGLRRETLPGAAFQSNSF